MKLRVHAGNEFRAFHIRFRDVARGGIRIIRSRNKEYVPRPRLFIVNQH